MREGDCVWLFISFTQLPQAIEQEKSGGETPKLSFSLYSEKQNKKSDFN